MTDHVTHRSPIDGRLHYRPETGQAVDMSPDQRDAQLTWARGVMASPMDMADDTLALHACRVLRTLSGDAGERDRASDLERLIEGEAG